MRYTFPAVGFILDVQSQIRNSKSKYAFGKNTRCRYFFFNRARLCSGLAVYGKRSDRCFDRGGVSFRRFNVRSRPRHDEQAIYALEHFSALVVSISSIFQTPFALVARTRFRHFYQNCLFYGRFDANFVSRRIRFCDLYGRNLAGFIRVYKSLDTNRRIRAGEFRRILFSIAIYRLMDRRGKPHFYRYGGNFCENGQSYRIFVKENPVKISNAR